MRKFNHNIRIKDLCSILNVNNELTPYCIIIFRYFKNRTNCHDIKWRIKKLTNVSLKGHQSNIKFSYFSYAADRLSDYKKEKVKTTFYKSFSLSFLSLKNAANFFAKSCLNFFGSLWKFWPQVKYGVRSPKFIWAPVYSSTHWLKPRNFLEQMEFYFIWKGKCSWNISIRISI